jgi:hypothetical protein
LGVCAFGSVPFDGESGGDGAVALDEVNTWDDDPQWIIKGGGGTAGSADESGVAE